METLLAGVRVLFFSQVKHCTGKAFEAFHYEVSDQVIVSHDQDTIQRLARLNHLTVKPIVIFYFVDNFSLKNIDGKKYFHHASWGGVVQVIM